MVLGQNLPKSMSQMLFPSENDSFIDTNSLNYFSLLPSDVDFSAGHYRITKVLSGREFSVEFDYEPQ